MSRGHRAERRRRTIVAVAIALVGLLSACSGSSHEATAPTTNAPTTTAPHPTTTTTPRITTRLVTGPTGAVTPIVAVQGNGEATIVLPATIGRPALLHSRYDGAASFVVRALDASGREVAVLVNSLGRYDGTVPVGFVEATGAPTAQLRVSTTGPWHLDLASATLAPALQRPGVAGRGDAVLSYSGPAVTAHVVSPTHAPFGIDTFSEGRVTMQVHRTGPFEGDVALPAGPAFVSVTSPGKWSMTLGETPG